MAHRHWFLTVLASVSLLLWSVTIMAAYSYSYWGAAASLESIPGTSTELNTPNLDGCPIMTRSERILYIASDRPGGLGGIDIWVAKRTGRDAPFGTPVNLGAPVNSPGNDFCPSPLPGGRFMFVSDRPGGCGGGDIYLTRRLGANGWKEPANLGCEVNSAAGEAGPVMLFPGSRHGVLYFSSNRPGGPGLMDLYMSEVDLAWSFQPAELVPGVNSPYDDARPSIRRDGKELLFDSTRPDGGLGGADIWSSSRDLPHDDWSAPVNLGPNVNSAANETRASISWDGKTLLFGSNRPGVDGASDVFYTTRTHNP